VSQILSLPENYGTVRTGAGVQPAARGELEFEIRSARTGQVLGRRHEHNIVKIFAKEILAHRIAHDKVWDPNANAGAGGWVAHSLDLAELAPKYIVFGASFDSQGVPLDAADTRYYTPDSVSGGYIPTTLGIGAEYSGGLINAIPISEPKIPLKRVERIFFEPSYQPAGTPLLQEDVRAINNVVVLETTLRKDEYNGFDVGSNDFFTLTEVALVGAREIGNVVGQCECDPRDYFLEAPGDVGILCNTSGTATISIDSSESGGVVDLIKEGDQIKIVAEGAGKQGSTLGQVTPYYLVQSKVLGGRDLVLDRTPVDADGNPLTGSVGVFRDGFRIFSHRILRTPIKKSIDFEIVVRWRVVLN